MVAKREGYITGIYGVWYDRAPGELIKGNGKTMTAVYLLHLDKKRGYKTYANIETNFTDVMETSDVYELFRDSKATGIAILLDEIQKDLNSMSGFTSPKDVVEFCNIASAQTRKRDIILYWTTQRAMDVPLRLRVQTDYLLQPVRIHADNTRCATAQCDKRHYIRVYSREPEKRNSVVTLDCAKMGKLYDTRQVLTDRMFKNDE